MPAGRIATAVSVPATASMQRWTVPSPPQTNSTSAPRAAARRACSGAWRLFFTSYHSGSVTPSGGQDLPELGQATAEALARVRHHGDVRHAGPSLPGRSAHTFRQRASHSP